MLERDYWLAECCDKCGDNVEPEHNAVLLAYVLQYGHLPQDVSILTLPGSRHLFPTRRCEGSPSRAQYLEGQPRDTRGYVYDEAYESLVREAYQTLIKLLNASEEV